MKKTFKFIFFGGATLTWAALIAWLVLGDKFERKVTETQAELIGSVADRYIAKNSSKTNTKTNVKTVAGLHHIDIEVDQFQENIYRASGVANSYLIKTNEGNVLFDTGLATQAAKHKRLLQEAAPGEIRYIILSHSHADHIGATKFWKAEFPSAQIITHQRFTDGQRYLLDLQDHFWNRNRLLYTFMPEKPGEQGSLFAYGGIESDITVSNQSKVSFELGGVEFVVLPTPGAEGADNIVLWLPQTKALFSGDFFGPLFPMMPNLFTLRGEKFRDPVDYTKSLETLIALEPELILPSHFNPHEGRDFIAESMTLMHDATQYVHDKTVEGMNQGKSVWQLMQEISLPPELAISQGHGKVSWNVRSIWEYYSTWFKFESSTELYAVPVRTLYPELLTLSGGPQSLIDLASSKLANGDLEQSLHLIEIAMSGNSNNASALLVKKNVLSKMLDRAWQTGSNFSETGWLKSRVDATQAQLDALNN